MHRSVWFLICAIFGLLMLFCGLSLPAHLRAVDARILQTAGRNTPGLITDGLSLVNEKKLGAAQLIAQAAQKKGFLEEEKLATAVDDLARQHPGWVAWGGPEPAFESIFQNDARLRPDGSEPFTEYVLRLENRERVLQFLLASPQPGVQELLRTRGVTNTYIFPPSQSASGQAFDAALSVCGLLLEDGHFTPGLSNTVFTGAWQATHGGSSQPFEQVLVDMMALGQRFNWGRLAVFVQQIDNTDTLRRLANFVRKAGAQMPTLFAAVHLSGQPAQVAEYLVNFSQTGLNDIGYSLRYGAGSLKELLARNQRLYIAGGSSASAGFNPFDSFGWWAADYCLRAPQLALAAKWLLYGVAGFLLAMAVHFARPSVSTLEQPLQVRGFHIAREILFALGFLLVVLLLSEPFLSQEGQRMDFPIRLRLPTVGNLLPAGTLNGHASFMNQLNLLTLLLFFVLQGLLYTACLLKLAEIRRQRVPARMKIKLLENEDHLFDAGLYLGFVGTIISLILVSLGIGKFSLMAAYSSTSFGIIFVSIFKIFHLRPSRRKLLLEAEATAPTETVPAAVRPTFATPS
ncbi:MAG TPA: hypothetical protein VL361_12195 [Candidatus Limnocylindrales bacterium]|nr:hypothetical protein [Candidatus Limnocylindrales bacterium]